MRILTKKQYKEMSNFIVLTRDKVTDIDNIFDQKIINIPFGVSVIGEGAFEGFVELEEIIISKSVEKISFGAFANCTYLKKVIINNPDCFICEDAFANTKFDKLFKKLGPKVFINYLNNINSVNDKKSFNEGIKWAKQNIKSI